MMQQHIKELSELQKFVYFSLKQPRPWKNCYLTIKSQTETVSQEVDFATLIIFYRPTMKNKYFRNENETTITIIQNPVPTEVLIYHTGLITTSGYSLSRNASVRY